ncbi:putative P-loop containing nucleoside triphosphate hydrolase [Helianthus annuus]|nr:putative P-loop containing nucleoside triphosphate hydrolase [Helianthus annuus]
MEGFEELAIQLAECCEGNPLALKVLGSSLSEGQGTRIETWRSTMNSLNSLKGDINNKIQGVLQKSFDTLPCESHRELFLHIACLFLGEDSYYVSMILEDEYHAESGIVTLINRCLVTNPRVSGYKLAMHKLLQEMARNIVRKDSKDPAEHSRVWRHDECKTLLRNGDGSKKIEGLVLKMRDDTQGMNFPDLRWLKWRKCFLKRVPACLLTNCLVALHMSFGDLEEFNPPMVDLGHMQWIKAYKDHKVDLVGDEITKDRTWNIQMLYEYGIRSTYLRGIKDQSMATHQYTSSSEFLSFRVPQHPKKHKIHGLNVTALYRSSGGETEPPPLFARISNRTRGVTWVYSPVVYCKPRVDEDVVWLSYWPIGNLFDAGDDVYVDIPTEEGTIIIRGYGASLMYKDGGEVEEKSEEEVIGGVLSRFKVTKGGYYLCRRDFFNSIIPAIFFGENIHITDSRRWRTCSELKSAFEEVNNYQNPNHYKCKVTLGVNFSSESKIKKIENAVSSIEGVESVSNAKEMGRLIVCGRFDHQAVVTCVREFEKIVQVLQREFF